MKVQIGDKVKYNGYIDTPTSETVPAICTGTVIGYNERLIYTDIRYFNKQDYTTQNSVWDDNVNISYGARRIGFHKSRLIEVVKPVKHISIPSGLMQASLFQRMFK